MQKLILSSKGHVDCMICLEPILDQHPRWAHESQPAHAAHASCLADWVEIKKICPLCLTPLNTVPLVGKSGRAFGLYQAMRSGFRLGGASGIMGSTAAVVVAGARDMWDETYSVAFSGRLQSSEIVLLFAIGHAFATLWVAKKLEDIDLNEEEHRRICKTACLSLALAAAAGFFPLRTVVVVVLFASSVFGSLDGAYHRLRR